MTIKGCVYLNAYNRFTHNKIVLKRSPRRQRGVALITALMIMAIAVTIIATIYVQQRYAIRLSHNIQDMELAQEYVKAAEVIAQVALKKDFAENKEDSLFDGWGGEIEPFEIDDDNGQAIGVVELAIEDLQGYFNINDIYAPKEKKPHEVMLKAFQRLLQNYNIPTSFALSVLDWVDPDDELSDPESAENAYYELSDPPYEAANDVMVDPSELYQIRMGFIDDEQEKARLIKALMPYVVALPTPTSVNVNTAIPEALEAIGLNTQQIQAIEQLRKVGPIKERTEVQSAVSNIDPKALGVLGVSSNYFRVFGQVRYGNARIFFHSTLFRSPDGKVHVIMRQFNRVAKKPKPKDSTFN